jgi:S1-C subfamily serine protease
VWLRRLAIVASLLLAAPLAHAGDGFGELERRIIEISDRVTPWVVHIEAIVRVNDRRSQVTGSGVLANAEGQILTNHHVVERAEKVSVSVPGQKRKFAARVVGTDRQTDMAVLRIDPAGEKLPSAVFGTSKEVRVGQWVLAVGNPYGLDGTVSLGIVSALGRDLELPDTLNEFIQTDAMIDRGSSGGPLVDLDGRVVGINSRGQGRGIGFTIPIDTALEVARDLEAGGVERGYLGITMQPLDRDLAEYFGHPDVTGTVVNGVIEDSPAGRAGVQPGDILMRINGTAIESEKDEDLGTFQRMVAAIEPGQKAELELLRAGKKKKLTVEIGAQPNVDPAEEEADVGFHVQEITARLARSHRLGTDEGAFVQFVARGSPAAEAGLFVGDVVERVEDRNVSNLDEFRIAMERVSAKTRFLIVARRGDETKYLLVKRGEREIDPAETDGDPGKAGLPEDR